MTNELIFGPLGGHCAHICVDMQRLFAEQTDWHMPWMARVRPVAERITAGDAADTIFTRFIPAAHFGEGHGTWLRYYHRWASVTLGALGEGMTELVPELARFMSPAEMVDNGLFALAVRPRRRHAHHHRRETDVCVLATVLGAVDRGYRVVVVTDALCSSSDAAHDASIDLYHTRYSQQVETVTAALLLEAWP